MSVDRPSTDSSTTNPYFDDNSPLMSEELRHVGPKGAAPATMASAAGGGLTATDFTIVFDGVSLDSSRHAWGKREQVLQDVTGSVGPSGIHCVLCSDDFIGLRMLQVLAGIERRLTGGLVMANAIPVASEMVRSRVGFITSIDGCMLEATVRENLVFCVSMRLDDSSRMDRIVQNVLEAVELVAEVDVLVEALTKGQRLRLAIAMELVLGPAVMMIANPLPLLLQGEVSQFVRILRGLSSGSCPHGVLAAEGRCMVVVSSAQLPYAFYQALDTLILLSSSGTLAFCGRKPDCEAFLHSILSQQSVTHAGTTSSSDARAVTVAGASREIEAAVVAPSDSLSSESHVEALSRGEAIADLMVQWDMEGEMGHVVNCFANSHHHRLSMETIHRQKESIGSGGAATIRRRHREPPVLKRMFLLLGYTVRRALYKADFIFAWVGLFVTFFLLAALSNKQGADQNGMQNKRGIIFFLLSCVTHVNSIFVEAEVAEYRSFVHLRNNQYFTVPEYFAATILRVAIPRVIFSAIGAAFASFIFSFALPLAVLLGLVSFTHHVLILLLTFWWPNHKVITRISLVYYAYSVMFSGFLICLSSVPGFLGDISVLRRAYAGAVAHELRDRPYSCDAQIAPNVTLAMSYCYTGNQYLQMEGFDGDSWGRSCAVLAIAGSILLALVAFSMKISWVSK